MKAILICAVLLAALTSTAQAGLREQCAASTGTTIGSAFNACMHAGTAPSQPKKPLYKDAASRARCRMGNC